MSWITFSLSFLQYLLLILGSVVFFKAACAVLMFLRISITSLDKKWAEKYGKGSWAIVTGCTEGIGKAFCFILADLSFNLVLVSRNEKKLEALSQQLWKRYPKINIIICQTDFSTYNRSLYENIMQKISQVDVSILVNNVGFAHINKFHQQTIKQIEDQINTNICSMAFMTQKLIPLFLERKQKCALINLSSQSVALSLKTLSVYTGTKAFNALFSQCLSQDYLDEIDILDCAPAIVSTAGTGYTKQPLSCTSEQCARWALKALGKTHSTPGHWKHIVQSWFTTIAGQTIVRFVGNKKLDDVAGYKKQ